MPGDAPGACDVCGTTEHVVVAERGRFRTPLRNVACRGCGLVFVSPRPSAEAIERFYATEYARSGLYYTEETDAAALDASARRVSRHRLRFLHRVAPKAPGRALEIGCGIATFLALLRDEGWTVRGVEPTVPLAERASRLHGIRVEPVTFEQAPLGDERYDLIALFHVLEHVASPTTVLGLIRSRLAPDGLLFLEVPNLLRPNVVRPEDFFQVAHLSTFTPATLRRALLVAGFEILAIDDSTRFLRAVVRPEPRGALPPVLPADDADDIVRLVERRRRWYPIAGYWRDAAVRCNSWARRAARGSLVRVAGRERTVTILRRIRGG